MHSLEVLLIFAFHLEIRKCMIYSSVTFRNVFVKGNISNRLYRYNIIGSSSIIVHKIIFLLDLKSYYKNLFYVFSLENTQ